MLSVLNPALDCVVGCLEMTTNAAGIVFQRVPGTARTRMADPALDFASCVPSGVRLEMLTDAPAIELDSGTVARFRKTALGIDDDELPRQIG